MGDFLLPHWLRAERRSVIISPQPFGLDSYEKTYMKTKQKPKVRLIYRLLLFVLPLLVLSVATIGIVLSFSNYRDMSGNLDRDYQSIINSSSSAIRFYMESARESLQSLARLLGAAKFDSFERQIALEAYNMSATNYMSIRLLSPDKDVLAATESDGVGSSFPKDKEFEAALGGETATSSVMFTTQNIPYICMAAPVFHQGKVTAVLWGQLSLKAVWSIIKDINIGETGEVCMTDSDGRVVAAQDMADVVMGASIVQSESIGELRASVANPISWTETHEGVKLYSLGRAIPSTPWIIVLRQTDREVYEYLYRNMRLSSIVTACICLFASLTGWLLIRRFLEPIHQLHEQVQRIGEGDFERRVDIKRRDEIGDLGVAVNGMAESIRAYIDREVENVRELTHARNLATLGAASSKVTHEVGNLLNNIETILFTLKREKMSPVAEQSIHTLEVETRRIAKFIENMLQFAKKPQLRLQRMGLDAVIQEVVFVYGAEAERRGARIELDWSPDLPPVQLDASLMYQVMSNIIKNSLETAKDPTIIHIVGEKDDNFLQVTIKDDGAGIEPHILEHIFEPFFSTKAAKGTGVGLSICKTIIEAHRGTIDCRSKAGEYAEFIIRLPLK